ncbi:MAG TPA: alpha/beta hydrolase [Microbacteriaceae bacterium]|nr:alpha/beta hydrolase [Microbacteriaceae bacterium]
MPLIGEQIQTSNIDLFNSKTHYVRLGNPLGKPLLMVHGFRGDHHGLLKIANELGQYQITIPDLPGFGNSNRLTSPHTIDSFGYWLKELAKNIMPEKYAVLGHSFGSLVVANAISKGLPAHKLILINPISQPALAGPKRFLTNAAKLYYLLGARMPKQQGDSILKNSIFVRMMSEVMAKTKNRELRAWIHDQHAQYFSNFTDSESLLEAFDASISNTVFDYSLDLKMETLLIAGELDDITPLSSQLRLKYTLPNAKLLTLPGTGHLVHYERAAEASHAINEFLNTKDK